MIGVLALQGGFAAHQAHLESLGVNHCQVRKPEHLHQCEGLIIPGGESSALLKLMAPLNWLQAIAEFAAQGKMIFGTCAGLILLAKTVSPPQVSLGLIDIDVERNAYGRQLNSFIQNLSEIDAVLAINQFEAVFIRAPKIKALGDKVQVLIRHQQQPVLVQQENIIVASFHPELSQDVAIHRYFVSCCQLLRSQSDENLCVS
ncbi:MAG: pyridoxal 5'-phosphate synthase glutaminase subunit PdxT [Coxiellaceae bacterium]|nr:pyridoxal 5'-phosphate synthase glutaminase subunit PdxT [Coxiellaceae bacterium]